MAAGVSAQPSHRSRQGACFAQAVCLRASRCTHSKRAPTRHTSSAASGRARWASPRWTS
jgi:hypothetical protein